MVRWVQGVQGVRPVTAFIFRSSTCRCPPVVNCSWNCPNSATPISGPPRPTLPTESSRWHSPRAGCRPRGWAPRFCPSSPAGRRCWPPPRPRSPMSHPAGSPWASAHPPSPSSRVGTASRSPSPIGAPGTWSASCGRRSRVSESTRRSTPSPCAAFASESSRRCHRRSWSPRCGRGCCGWRPARPTASSSTGCPPTTCVTACAPRSVRTRKSSVRSSSRPIRTPIGCAPRPGE